MASVRYVDLLSYGRMLATQWRAPPRITGSEDIRYVDELGYWMRIQLPVAANSDDASMASFHKLDSA